jgi:hypothetical protein
MSITGITAMSVRKKKRLTRRKTEIMKENANELPDKKERRFQLKWQTNKNCGELENLINESRRSKKGKNYYIHLHLEPKQVIDKNTSRLPLQLGRRV